MVSRRHRVRFFSRAAPLGFSPLTRRKRKAPPLRYVFLILVTLGGLFGWSFWGGQFMASLNPAIRMQLHLLTPALDAWISPPDYTGLPPIMIATPAGSRFDGEIIEVPRGSILTAHLADHDGDTPELLLNGERIPFTPDRDGDFEVAHVIESGATLAIRRGWQDIHAWKIRVIGDQPPEVAFVEPPSITEHKAVRLAYEASDDFGVTSVAALITPRARPGIDATPIEIPLASPDAKSLRRVNIEDLTSYAWAGDMVQIQLLARDGKGHTTTTAAVDINVPERVFYHPVARALIEERGKLLQSPEDEGIRNEVANVMAGVAHVPVAYHGDNVVLMALRSGAVRLVLDRRPEINGAVSALLWQAAVQIEDGPVGIAERRLHETQRELADGLDGKATQSELQGLVERLRQALTSYLSALSMRAAHPGPETLHGSATPAPSVGPFPLDTDKMLEKIKDLSVSGESDAARDELLKLQQQLEVLRNGGKSFTEEMRRRSGSLEHPQDGSAVQRLMQNF
ncbi:MAG: DUF4175 domain-containing protein [Pseudomonadota bacterium]|nr:DUF4175 domain-containing protein [Pseudomonadota bacterium]